MHKKEVKRWKKAIAHAGGVHERRKTLKSAVASAQHDQAQLEKVKAARRAEFHHRKEEWRGKPADRDEAPHALPHERRVARLFRMSGWFAILLECFLAVIISVALGFPWWVGVVIAVFLAAVLHGGLTMLCRRSGRPRESYAMLKRWVLTPALILAVASLLVLLAVRSVTGSLLLALLPFLTISLWTATASLILLSAALLVAADVFDWSSKDAQEYEGYEREQQRSVNLRREWEEDLEELEKSAQEKSPRPQAADQQEQQQKQGNNGNAAAAVTRIAPALLLVGLLALGSACQTTVGGQGESPPQQPSAVPGASPQRTLQGRTLELDMDASMSPDDGVYRLAVANVRRSLPGIIEDWDVRTFSVLYFAEDGWNAELQLRLELPQLILPQAAKKEGGELSVLPNVEEAQSQRVRDEQAAGESYAREKYRGELAAALAPVTEDALLPPTKSEGAVEPPCTELTGVLTRASSSTARIVFVITDGAETCRAALKTIPEPAGDVIVIVVLLPEKNRGGQESFELRSKQIVAACKWCIVVPHFTEDYGKIISEVGRRKASNGKPANP